jgi:hypothetical protein
MCQTKIYHFLYYYCWTKCKVINQVLNLLNYKYKVINGVFNVDIVEFILE